MKIMIIRFQMESLEARKMCVQAQANDIEDVIAINAANRPRNKRWISRILFEQT